MIYTHTYIYTYIHSYLTIALSIYLPIYLSNLILSYLIYLYIYMYNESRTPKIFLEPVLCHAQTLRQDLGNVVLSEVWTLPTVSVGFFRGQNLGQMGEVLGDLVNWKKLLPYGKLTVCY